VREYEQEMRRSQRAAKEAANYYPDMAARSGWRLSHPWGNAGFTTYDHGPVMLRLTQADGEIQIETSHGARIPASHAPRIWRLAQACIASGRPYERNGHTEHAGEYAIDRVDANGTLHAGCHVIPHSELRSMARQLGLS
jgi:hypothetical protein